METVLLALLVVLIVLVIILIALFLFKKSNISVDGVDKNELSLLHSQLETLNIKTSGELKEYINSLNNTSNDKLTDFERRIKEDLENNNKKSTLEITELEKAVKEWVLNQSNQTKAQLDASSLEVKNLLNTVKENSMPIADVKTKVDKLDNLLSQNNKAGKSGEYLLERMFENLTGIHKDKNLLFEKQYTMIKIDENGKGLKPDLFIKGGGEKFANIAVDSKFSFNAYLELQNMDENSESYANKIKTFKTDIKTRIKETSKYNSEEDNTVYSIMFVPSEGIFSFINNYPDLIEEAFKNKVIIAGPSTLMGIVHSVDKYMSLFDTINQYDKKIEALKKVEKYMSNYDDQMINLFKSIENLNNQYLELKKKENSLTKKYKMILQE